MGRTLFFASSLLVLACGSSKDEPSQIPCSGGGNSCETDPNPPAALLDAARALRATTDGKRGPSTVTISLVPNHWSTFWQTPSIGLAVAKRELGCVADMTAAALKGDPDAIQKQIDRLNTLVDQKVN